MEKPLKSSQIFNVIEKWAPLHLAYDWDNVGLQIGSYSQEVKKVMVTLDVIEAVVDEAISKDVDLIIAHHPLLFKPLRRLNVDDVKGKIIEKLIKQQISVYAAHTNLDIAKDGVNDMLCKQLDLKETYPLTDLHHEPLFKLTVFVPLTHIRQVQDALSEGGAGHIGDYSHCTFQTKGKGTFKPLEGTNPYIGTTNQLEEVDEIKIETIVKGQDLNRVLRLMIAAHPYEEVAYDIYPLENKASASLGLGRIGKLNEPVTLEVFVHTVKEKLNVSHVRVTGNLEDKIEKVAVLGGSGEKYIHQAKRQGADVYITGDMTFHNAQDAMVSGLNVIDAGHYIEQIMKQEVARLLCNHFNGQLEVIISETNTEPFRFM